LFSSVLRTHRPLRNFGSLNDNARLVAGTVFEFETASEKVSRSPFGTRPEELLLLGFLLGLFLGFRHGASPVVTG
jgi:hypothetical protein